jgi:hypothetical protein
MRSVAVSALDARLAAVLVPLAAISDAAASFEKWSLRSISAAD